MKSFSNPSRRKQCNRRYTRASFFKRVHFLHGDAFFLPMTADVGRIPGIFNELHHLSVIVKIHHHSLRAALRIGDIVL